MLLALVIGCTGGGEETGAPAPPTYAEIQYVFDRNCTGSCHAGAAPFEGLVLTADVSYAMLVGVASAQAPDLARVAPGDAAGSYLLHKLRGTHVDAGGSGNAMPPYLVLADTELEVFRAWIAAGAEP